MRAASESSLRVRLVYARTSSDSSEPLIAVCNTEAEARAIEHEVVEAGSGVEVRWETHEVLGEAGDKLYAVMQAPSMSPEPAQELDPIGVAVFALQDEAELYAAGRRQRDGVDHYVLWSLQIGWRRPGWPFDGTTPAP